MNKYQEALSEVIRMCAQSDELFPTEEIEALQELVDRATSKKPINQSTPVVRQGYCPNCKGELRKLGRRNEVVIEGQLYCCSCGQALDWSEEYGNQ